MKISSICLTLQDQIWYIHLKGLLKKHLQDQEYEVLRLSYGLDCDKHSDKVIEAQLNISGVSN